MHLKRGGGDDALGRAADAEQDVGAGLGPRGGDGADHVAVGDEPDAGAGGADLGDEVVVAVAVEDDGGEVADRLALGLGHASAGSRSAAGVMSIEPARLGPDGDLLHVDARPGVEHGAALAHGDHRDGVAPTERGERRALDRVDRDVGVGVGSRRRPARRCRASGASSFSPSPMTTTPSIGTVLSTIPHRLDRGAVGAVLVASSHPPRGGQGRRLGDADQLEGEVPIRLLPLRHGRTR